MAAGEMVFAGVDLGTGGVRALAADSKGRVLASAQETLSASPAASAGRHEQEPSAWRAAMTAALRKLSAGLAAAGVKPERLAGLAVDGTSGTLAVMDAQGRALRPALMYNDGRAAAEAEELNGLAGGFLGRMGYRFAASYALAKALWVARHEAEAFGRARWLLSQADCAVGWLTGVWGVTDYSNALKMGYDLIEERWPAWMEGLPGVAERLAQVKAPGDLLGRVTRQAAAETGLPEGTPVMGGATDGTAAFLASGARRPGDVNTTLGTTLVFKVISHRIVVDPSGVLYCHKLPGGLWLPGGAGNVGGEWVGAWFAGQDPAALDWQAAGLLPALCAAYPLARKGERFPFLSAQAEGFFEPEPASVAERYAACLQGVAMVERLAYEKLEAAAGAKVGDVFATGGGSRSDVWTQLRADMTGRVMRRPACPESAMGACVLAAAGRLGGVWAAAEQMARVERVFEPAAGRGTVCGEVYGRWVEALKRRGYL